MPFRRLWGHFSKCLQLMGTYVLSGCDTVSYPFSKGKISALNCLQADDFTGLFQVLVKRMPRIQTSWKQVKGSSHPYMVSHQEPR